MHPLIEQKARRLYRKSRIAHRLSNAQAAEARSAGLCMGPPFDSLNWDVVASTDGNILVHHFRKGFGTKLKLLP